MIYYFFFAKQKEENFLLSLVTISRMGEYLFLIINRKLEEELDEKIEDADSRENIGSEDGEAEADIKEEIGLDCCSEQFVVELHCASCC